MTRSRARLSAPLAILVAGALFVVLMRGGAGFSSMTTRGYAEVVEHAVAPLRPGRVARVVARMGQHVVAGEVVAVMETYDLQLKLEAARLTLARANAQLAAEEVVAGAAVARAELLVLRLQSTQTRDRAQLAEVEQQRARLEKLAQEQLVQAGDVEKQRLKEADLTASLQVLDAATKARQAGLGRNLGGKAAADQLAKRLEPMREAVRLRAQEVKIAELELAEATVRTHVEGVVTLVLHHEGDVVPAATELVRIATGRPGRIVCWVPERQAQGIEAGRSVHLRGLSFWGGAFAGRIAELAPEIEEVPPRARLAPQIPAWGRRIEIESWPPHPFVLGEAVHVRF